MASGELLLMFDENLDRGNKPGLEAAAARCQSHACQNFPVQETLPANLMIMGRIIIIGDLIVHNIGAPIPF